MSRNIIVVYLTILFIALFSCKSPNNSQPIPGSFLGQTAPGVTPIRFASDIITDNFYPHSRLIISPEEDRIFWTTFLDTVSSDKALYYSHFDGENLSIAVKETAFDAYGILSFIFLNDDNNILFGSLQPYDKMEGKLVRAVWTSEKTEAG